MSIRSGLRRAIPEPGDLILAREAPAGNVAIIREGQTVCLGQRTVHLRPDREKVDPDFLCYYLLAPRQQGALLAGETGATAGHVNVRDIRRLKLGALPTVPEQQRRGQIIAAYDDLIENNRRRIALLEKAARMLTANGSFTSAFLVTNTSNSPMASLTVGKCYRLRRHSR